MNALQWVVIMKMLYPWPIFEKLQTFPRERVSEQIYSVSPSMKVSPWKDRTLVKAD